eukprot:TRINITY_DN5708_c0_g1_i3.p1 TRINITY_DN5708_c0_g1~~TRINITY_DN5708_c0_g1_i3.p1  ORF type:complete len:388 (-),score=89.46 TRINITY_DN5708_c0_g1_i3:398-1504(-)
MNEQELLAQFISITGIEDIEVGKRLLEENQWDLNRAVNASLAGQSSPVDREPHPNLFSPHPIHMEHPLQQMIQSMMMGQPHNLQQNLHQIIHAMSPIPGMMLQAKPYNSRQFRDHFEHRFGTVHPTFIQTSFNQAIDKARSEIKFLIAFVHDAQNPAMEKFCRESLCAEFVTTFINEHFIFWAGDITDSEGYSITSELRNGILGIYFSNSAGDPILVDSITDGLAPNDLIFHLINIMDEKGFHLDEAKAEQMNREMDRMLREQQDADFAAALAADAEKERQLEETRMRDHEEKAFQQFEDEAKKISQLEISSRKSDKKRRLVEVCGDEAGSTLIAIRLLDGKKIQRRFHSTQTIQVNIKLKNQVEKLS